jgi:hypothetical protein
MSSPSSALEGCTEWLTHARVTVKAHGRAATFLNPDKAQIRRVDVDCWLRSNATIRSDFIICKAGMVDVVVELKGKDIFHAIDQILATVELWRRTPVCSGKLGALIVFTRSPERSTMLETLRTKLLIKRGVWLEMGKSGLKEYNFEVFMGARR